MVTSIARQSVIIKCNQQTSVLLGNYEFYYLAGLMNQCFGLTNTKDLKPEELYESISSVLTTLQPQDEKEQYMIKLLTLFEPKADYDKQMQELFEMGENESNMWQIHLP